MTTVDAQALRETATAAVNRNVPAHILFEEALLQQLDLPAGFKVNVFASARNDPRMLEVDPDGTVYVTRWKSDDVLALRDTNRDGGRLQDRPPQVRWWCALQF